MELDETSQAQVANRDTVFATGYFDHAAPGVKVTGTGLIKESRRGLTFECETFDCTLPQAPGDLIRYFESGAVPLLGKPFAERVVPVYGSDTLRMLTEFPEGLMRCLNGYSLEHLKRAAAAWKEARHHWMKMPILESLNIEHPVRARIIKDLRGTASLHLKSNPYLVCGYEGGEFRTVDDVVTTNPSMFPGLSDPMNINRTLGAFIYVMKRWENGGHTAAPVSEILEQLVDLLGVSDSSKLVNGSIKALIKRGLINVMMEGDTVLLQTVDLANRERAVAAELRRIYGGSKRISLTKDGVVDNSEWGLFKGQRHAVEVCLEECLAIINGGPGTGKTTTLNSVIASIKEQSERQDIVPRILALAPSGLAAERITAATGLKATTAHDALQAKINEGFFKNSRNQLDVDVLILDEVGNMGLETFLGVLRATPDHSRIIISGDVDQLPSIEPGFILNDMIASNRIAVARLTEVGRQKAGSKIPMVSTAINSGNLPDLNASTEDWGFIDRECEHQAKAQIVKIFLDHIASGVDVMDVQVLCSQHSGTTGTIALNKEIQGQLSRLTGNPVIGIGKNRYMVGDKVIINRPLKPKKLSNGTLGKVKAVCRNSLVLDISGREVAFEENEVNSVSLAYAKSIHKSQGSEYKFVIAPICKEHEKRYTRQKLFTVNSRAKTRIEYVGSVDAFKKAVMNTEGSHRHTGLQQHLRDSLPHCMVPDAPVSKSGAKRPNPLLISQPAP